MADRGSQYSTLEPCGDPSQTPNTSSTATIHTLTDATHQTVHDPAPQEYYSAPEVYYPPEPDLPEPVGGYYSPPAQDPLPEAVVKVDGPSKDGKDGAAVGAAAPGKRICGLTPKLFTIIAIAASVIIVGLGVGVGVGVSVGKRKSNASSTAPDGNGTAPNSTASNVLAESQIGAVLWEDSRGNDITSVFFQDTTKGIGLAQFNASSKKWAVKSVSDDLYNTTSQSVTPGTGTPLIPLCLGWVDNSVKIELYFLSASTIPTSIYSEGQKANNWKQDQLASSWTGHPLSSGTNLAVYEDYCAGGCANKTYVLGENDAHNFVTFARASPTASAWAFAQVVVGVPAPSPINLFQNSSLALTRAHGNGTSSRDGLRMYVDVGGQLNEYLFNNASWNLQPKTWSLDQAGQTAYQSPDIAAVSFSDSKKAEIVMFTILYRNGSVAVWWQPSKGTWSHDMAPVSSVSAVALHDGPKAYVLSGGVLTEYNVDITSPAKWTFSQNVTTDYT